ncbi:MAG: sugar phosphate isomerase/epimerase, partial [Armatimonadota bacterium]|nr:sugar phosphate isomerase/epimerase [Armatimonadota bacterium]
MQLILFTKFLKTINPTQIAEAAMSRCFDGLDLAVRAGHAINPRNVEQSLPEAVQLWKEAGLSVPLVTLEGNATDPDDPEVQAIFRACGSAGIPNIKLGYWVWQTGESYWDRQSDIHRQLAKFQHLSKETGVRSLVHTHSGPYYGSNASGVMDLVCRFDPRRVGIYMDPAHLALDGEPLAMALNMVRTHLAMVAAKNAVYRPQQVAGASAWVEEWVPLRDGLVHWPSALRLLNEAGYD